MSEYQARIAWKVENVSGHGEWHNLPNRSLVAWIDYGNKNYGPGTHWLEYRDKPKQPGEVSDDPV